MISYVPTRTPGPSCNTSSYLTEYSTPACLQNHVLDFAGSYDRPNHLTVSSGRKTRRGRHGSRLSGLRPSPWPHGGLQDIAFGHGVELLATAASRHGSASRMCTESSG